MLDVYFTIDVEVWCDGWNDLDRKFPDAFRRYIHGPNGEHGLPFQLKLLGDHGLKAVCFVEPLFSGRFGRDPLEEIVQLVKGAGHEVQLHLHTEWLNEFREPVIPGLREERQFLRQFNRPEQSALISLGIEWLEACGAPRPKAFRAGGFGLSVDTLHALSENGIFIDSSYNATRLGDGSGLCPGETIHRPRRIGGVLELPLSVYEDGLALRHVQLNACSAAEIEGLLWQATEAGHRSLVILSHSSELLNSQRNAPDPVVVRRLRRLCAFLERHSDCFKVRGLADGPPEPDNGAVLRSPLWRTSIRLAEQAWRRLWK